jgi:predicted methyltransferase
MTNPMILSTSRRLRLGLLLLFPILAGSIPPVLAAGDPGLEPIIDGPQRSLANRARDTARHPLQELNFFGVKPNMTVVEIWPGGGGYWTEILAPYLKDHGAYYAAQPDGAEAPDESKAGATRFKAKVEANPALYGKVRITALWGDQFAIAPAGCADLVVTFRNLHNWMAEGNADGALRAFYKALKPGGMLGIEDHRGRLDQPQDPKALSGYVREDYAIALAEKAGFMLAGRSEINANPRDTKNYPEGVWTLPPVLRLGDKDRDKYLAIGEADGFVLLFVKPYRSTGG